MDAASRALAEGLEPTEPRTYAALSKRHGVARTTVWNRAHGVPSIEEKAKRQQYLTPFEEKALVKYLLRMSDNGYPVAVKYLRSLAFIIARQRSTTAEAINPPGKNWPQAFHKRHPELKPKKVKAIDWNRHDRNIYDKITHWFEVIGKELHDPIIAPENVFNMDETGVMLSMLGSIKVLVGKDDPRDYRGAGVKREMVTAIECISADGKSLLPMIVWPAATHRSNWTTYPTPGWHYACSQSGYTDSKISLEWIKRVFDPQTKVRAHQKPRVLICDGFGTHETLEILEYCLENNIILCRIPSHTSHKLQPCDIGVFGPLKAAYRDEVERLYRGGANTVGKEHFTSLYSPAREKALTSKNIMAGWIKAGLYPFNPDRVLRGIPKPPAELTIPKANEVRVWSCPEGEVLQTPATAEALTSLHNLIEQEAHALDAISQQRLQKFAKAAQISFAECALLQDENQLLFKQNDEAKRRKSTKSTVVGKAKVMSYEDIVEARGKRAAKEAAKDAAAVKQGRGRKRKSPPVEAAKAKKGNKVRRSEVEVAQDEMAVGGLGDYCSVLQL